MSAQPAITYAQAALAAKIEARRAAAARVDELCLRASRLLKQAATIASDAQLGDLHVQKARAAAGLAETRFHTITGHADAVDMDHLRDDLARIARHVDPLIAAIGEEARTNTPGAAKGEFDDCFQRVLANAFEGNANFVLEKCAENVGATINDADDIAEHRRELQRTE
jgi:hypothetical protein